MTNEHTSLEKYTSHTLCERVAKGLCVRGELETEQTATYWPLVPLTIAALLFSFWWAAQPGFLRSQALCWELVLTTLNCNSNFNCNWLQLTQTVAPGYIIVCRPSVSRGRRNCTDFNPSTGQGNICDIFDRIDGWVEDQYVTWILHLDSDKVYEKEVDWNYTRMVRVALNKYWKLHSSKSSCKATYLPSHTLYK